MIDIIAFDADDTLWHNESIYLGAKTEFAKLFSGHQSAERVLERLNETEIHKIILWAPIRRAGIRKA